MASYDAGLGNSAPPGRVAGPKGAPPIAMPPPPRPTPTSSKIPPAIMPPRMGKMPVVQLRTTPNGTQQLNLRRPSMRPTVWRTPPRPPIKPGPSSRAGGMGW